MINNIVLTYIPPIFPIKGTKCTHFQPDFQHSYTHFLCRNLYTRFHKVSKKYTHFLKVQTFSKVKTVPQFLRAASAHWTLGFSI